MTTLVTIKNEMVLSDHQNPKDYTLHLKVFDRRVVKTDITMYGELPEASDVLVSEYWIEPGEQQQLHVWKERYFIVEE